MKSKRKKFWSGDNRFRIMLTLELAVMLPAAALIYVNFRQGLISAHTAANPEPEAIVTRVNRDLCRRPSVAPLASLFVARLDPDAGTMDYCSAGHPPAMLLRADGRLESLSIGGPLVGVLPEASFVRGSVELRASDVALAYSDGVVESLDNADQEFGYERLKAELRRAQPGPTAPQGVRTILPPGSPRRCSHRGR